jgi:DNA-binding transcriptional ArsR family regulator
MGGKKGKIQLFGISELLNRSPPPSSLIRVRPLLHPSIEDITVEGILYALSDPVRVAIYADIAAQECTQNCSTFLTVSDKAIPRSTLSQHFKILRENGLIRGERHGVEMRNTSRCAEIEGRFPGLLRAILHAHMIQSAAARAKMPAATKAPKRVAKKI